MNGQLSFFKYETKPKQYKNRKNTKMISTSLALTPTLIKKIQDLSKENETSFVDTVETILKNTPISNVKFKHTEKRKKLGLSLPETTYLNLKKQSEYNQLTLNEVFEQVIKYYFSHSKKK